MATARHAYGLSNVGRVYLNPQDRSEVWCYFGFEKRDNQVYPAYPGEFGVTKEQYDKVVANVKQVMDKYAIDDWEYTRIRATDLSPLFLCGVPCCLNAAFKGKVTKLNEMLQEAATNAAPQGVEVTVKSNHKPSPLNQFYGRNVASELPSGGGNWVDSMGQVGLGMHARRPPIGYSIIFKVPEPVQAWPLSSPDGVPLTATAATAVAADASPAANDPMQQIAMLKSLLDSGALTQAEFDSKKAGFLAQM